MLEKLWKRTTDEEKYHAKYIGRRLRKVRGQKAKVKAWDLKMERRAAIRIGKAHLGRRLNAEEVGVVLFTAGLA